MIDIRLMLQNALCATAHDHAVPIGMSLLDNFLRNLHHLIGIENQVVAKCQPGGESSATHGLLVESTEP